MSARTPQQQLGEEVPAREDQVAEQEISVANRITVGIIPTAWAALQKLMARTQLNRTDVVNRAISVYAMVDEHTQKGYELVFRDPRTGTERIVTII
ncbi:MAG TPA: hypothetical protein VLJ59_01720 [Mycobacteriales bacterium]|nr:hypothetical protein [Mycobacteriales bacterium]